MYLFKKLSIIIVILKLIIVKYMNIQCPNCETVFELPNNEKSNKKYKCSVCNYVWTEDTNKYRQIKNLNVSGNADFKKVLILNTIIFLIVILAFIIFRNHLENIDNNWKTLYSFFDMLIPIQ